MWTRRTFVKLAGAGLAWLALPACGDDASQPPERGAFFDEHAWATIDLATDVLLPGARDCRAVRYIDTLLSAFEQTPPAIFGGGPYSGRTAFPDGTVPANDFAQFLPLSRVQELAWRARIYGSAATPGADFNDAVLGPTVGWRDLYLAGVAALDAAAMSIGGAPFVSLSDTDRAATVDRVASDAPAFYAALLAHAIEGAFAAPEYGGNADLRGWQLSHYDGDSAPLGNAQYSAAEDRYIDRADQPTSAPAPGAASEDFSPDVANLLTVAAIGSGGRKFF